jgi:glutamate-1-semialdehyde 2,1-aminomutase
MPPDRSHDERPAHRASAVSPLGGPPSHHVRDAKLGERAADVIPGGSSTGSKRPSALYGRATHAVPELPTHYERASGCTLLTAGGIELVDCTMALGAVALGYADADVTRRVTAAANAGHVAGLPHRLEVEVAERLCEVIPCAEQVRFLKTGAEGTAAAVRIARTLTGRADVIASGYFGWLDWCSDAAGVPEEARANVHRVPFDDVSALESAAERLDDRLAAIIVEPVVEQAASDAWLLAARRICDRTNAVLVYDEVKTAFRLRTGGYQEMCGIEPDLAVIGKALANGYPLAAVVGRAGVMEAATQTWISSTLAGEATALAAAAAVLDRHEQTDVSAELWEIGASMRRAVQQAIDESGVQSVTMRGLDPMWFLDFGDDARASTFVAHGVRAGVLFKHGAYDFASLAHDESATRHIGHAALLALNAVRALDELT